MVAKYDVSQAERSHVPPLPGPSQAFFSILMLVLNSKHAHERC